MEIEGCFVDSKGNISNEVITCSAEDYSQALKLIKNEEGLTRFKGHVGVYLKPHFMEI